MEISDVYEGDYLMMKNTESHGKEVFLSLNRKEQTELCVFLAATRPQMILTAVSAAEAKKDMSKIQQTKELEKPKHVHKWGTGDIIFITIMYLISVVGGLWGASIAWEAYNKFTDAPGSGILLLCTSAFAIIAILATIMIFVSANRLSDRIAEQKREE